MLSLREMWLVSVAGVRKPPKLWPKQKFLFYVKINLAVMGWYIDFRCMSLRNPSSFHFVPWQS